MEVIDRIQELIVTKCGNNKREFTRAIDVKYTTFDNQLKANNFSQKVLCAILEAFPDIDANWLLMGEGEMYKSSANEMAEERIIVSEPETETNNEVTELKNQVQALLQLLANKDKQMSQLINLLSNAEEIKKQKLA